MCDRRTASRPNRTLLARRGRFQHRRCREVRTTGLVVVLFVMAAACSGGGIEQADLPRLILQEADAPEGTFFVAEESGAISLEELTGNTADQQELLANGFVSGYEAIFASPGLAGIEGDISLNRARIVDSSLFLFETSDGAATSFTRFREEAQATFVNAGDVADVTIPELGTDTFGMRVEFFNPAAGPDIGILHTWRMENLIARIVVYGDGVENAEVRALVDVLVARIDG